MSKTNLHKGEKMYKRTKQLNSKESRATASVVLVDKVDTKKEDRFASFVKINDCNNSIYLHPHKNIHHSKKAKRSYLKKIKILQKELSMYIKHIEKIK